jgi:hypothetical protein
VTRNTGDWRGLLAAGARGDETALWKAERLKRSGHYPATGLIVLLAAGLVSLLDLSL